MAAVFETLKQKETYVVAGRKLATIGALLVGSILTFGDSYLDLAGDLHLYRTTDEIDTTKEAKVTDMYAAASVAGRYSMLFVQPQGYNEGVFVGNLYGGSGLMAAVQAFPHDIDPDVDEYRKFGQDCLLGTSYDTTPSEIRGRASGDISAIATLNVEEGIVTVYPAASEAAPLRFSQGDQGEMSAADEHTQNTLAAYGCNPDLTL